MLNILNNETLCVRTTIQNLLPVLFLRTCFQQAAENQRCKPCCPENEKSGVAPLFLLSDFQPGDNITVPIDVLLHQVVQKAPSLTNHL